MEQEASDFYNRTKEFQPEYWFLDVEEKSMKNMRAGVSAYVRKLRQSGVKKLGIYIGHHLYKSFNLKPAYPCDIHQYTSKGRLKGYNGNLDLNRIISNFKFNNKPDIEEEIGTNYIVKSGDTLWGLSRGFSVSIDDLVKWNNIKNRDLIFAGQILKVGPPGKSDKGYQRY